MGSLTESAHFKRLAVEERELSDITVSDMRRLPPNWTARNPVFVCENVVIANDYLKSFLWRYRKIFGGPCLGFQKLLERARREATVRMMRRAKKHGANVVWNVRFDSVTIQMGYKDANGNHVPAGVEVCAYGTAFLIES
jgi:uncharacterized protein YbjQ (UPF0145 family)